MVTTDTLEGTIDRKLWFHYDLSNDVLYLRFIVDQSAETLSEETPDGLLLLRRADNDKVAGLTIINWWKRFGTGAAPASIIELEQRIEPWAHKLAA